MEELLTIEEAAQIMKIKPNTIRNWIGLRKIPFRKIGRCIRFDTRSLEAWMKRRDIQESEVWR